MNLDVAAILRGADARVWRLVGGAFHQDSLTPADLQRTLTGVSIDSRHIAQDSLFVALKGERVDGHEFVPEALKNGALGCLVSRLPEAPNIDGTRYLFVVPDPLAALQRLATSWREMHDVEVIGVTGSIGKTTTKEIVSALLSAHLPVLKSEANLNTEIGLPLMLLRLRSEHRTAVLEMGMYLPGDIALLAGIARPHVGIVTNVGPIHLERVGSIERIARAKSELIASLPHDGLAILNGDDPWTRAMAETTGIARVVRVGLEQDCEYRAADIRTNGLAGVSFAVVAENDRIPIETRVPGRHTIHAFLSAIATARFMGMSWEDIRDAASAVRLESRQRIIREPGVLIIDDSYNAAPMSVTAALELLRESPGTRIAVLGDMLELGTAEERAHLLVGESAAQVADYLVARGPRSRWIVEGARSGGLAADRVRWVAENDEAVSVVRDIMETGAGEWAVLVKGSRGMRMEEVVDGLQAMGPKEAIDGLGAKRTEEVVDGLRGQNG